MNDLAVVGLEWLGALTLFLGFIIFVRYLDHRERMTMIERGLVPSATSRGIRKSIRGSALLRGGLITSAVGIAVTLGLYTIGYLLPAPFNAVPGRLGPWLLPGLIPAAVGLALVASYYLSPQRSEMLDDADGETSSEEQAQRRVNLHIIEDERKQPPDDRAGAADA